MPELPEVEITARALAQRLVERTVDRVEVFESRLRQPVTADLAGRVRGQRVLAIGRRGKYLLWRFPSGTLISHLGMSGSWRVHRAAAVPARLKHDHVEIACGPFVARFHDPRRFGALLWHEAGAGAIEAHPLLARLGIEPFDARFGGAWLHAALRSRPGAIKTVLLAGQVVVGVGNIYATESLFAARIHPQVPARRLSRARCERLAQAVRAVLGQAIDAGGSTLRNFSSVEGASGRYTEAAQAYGRQGLPCPRCTGPIRRIVQGQRATYFCPRCQRRQ